MSGSPTGTIHDLGYKRYAGARFHRSTRWRVVARNQIATSWKTWWRYKAPLGLAVITTFIAGGVMFIFEDRMVRQFAATIADAALPKSIQFYTRCAFWFSMSVASRAIAGDVKAGAFTFYFARSIQPRDYVLGKLVGTFLLVATLSLAGPVLLAIARLGLTESPDQLVEALPWIPKAIAVGTLGALVFTTVPLAVSSLVRNPHHATAIWAAYYLVVGLMLERIGKLTGSPLGALDLPTSIDVVAAELFELNVIWGRASHVGFEAAVISVLAHVVIALAIIVVRVRRFHGAGIGGAS